MTCGVAYQRDRAGQDRHRGDADRSDEERPDPHRGIEDARPSRPVPVSSPASQSYDLPAATASGTPPRIRRPPGRPPRAVMAVANVLWLALRGV